MSVRFAPLSPSITRFEQVQDQTTEDYFGGNQFSIDAFTKKYAAFPGETYVQSLKRVCDYIAAAEKTEELRCYWSERWFDEIYNDWWHPAGSITQGAGCGRNVSLANCNTTSLGALKDGEEWDNLESIIRNTLYTVAKSAAFRQGLGVDFSRLRPRGSAVLNSSNESAGAIHWMKLVDSIGYYVGQKGRIPAMLFSLSCEHPDLMEFVNSKVGRTSIQNANISVQITEDFYHAVEEDREWEMSFEIPEVKVGQRVYVDRYTASTDTEKDERGYYNVARRNRAGEKIVRRESARKILELIAHNMFHHAEPGIQNIDLARKMSNSDYVYDPNDEYDSRVLSTNACSEQYLSRDSLCFLASQNAGRFSSEPKKFEAEQETIGCSVNRFLDNAISAELAGHTYATPLQKLANQKLRRTGAGFTNMGAWLFKQGLVYGTPEATEAVRWYTERFNYHLYRSSIETGREKGSFGLFNREKLERSPFIKRMVNLGLEFDALRNVTCSSIAPTGSLSLMFRREVMSYGAEPGFGLYYWKRTRISGQYEYYFCVPAVVRDVLKDNGISLPIESDTVKDTWDGQIGKPVAKIIDEAAAWLGLAFKPATEVTPFEKLDMMAAMMESVDSSISITYLLPENTKPKDVYEFILAAHKRGVKSVAAFPDRQMYGIVSFEPFRDLAERLQSQGVEIHAQNFSEEELAHLGKNARVAALARSEAPKRPQELPCEIHLAKLGGEPYTVLVGLLGGTPYEVMVVKSHATRHETGTLTKVKRGQYQLVSKKGDVLIANVGENCGPDLEALTRLVSTALRHGTPIQFVAGQLLKVSGGLQSVARCLGRTLKKYITDGTKVAGETCTSCGAENSLVHEGGCSTCSLCLTSKCA